MLLNDKRAGRQAGRSTNNQSPVAITAVLISLNKRLMLACSELRNRRRGRVEFSLCLSPPSEESLRFVEKKVAVASESKGTVRNYYRDVAWCRTNKDKR